MWNKVFNAKNPFWMSMGTVFDLFVMNLVWLISCIPIVTIGPATCALFYALIERVQEHGSYITYDYRRSFKRNFKQAMKLGVGFTLVICFLLLDMYLCYHAGRGIFSFFLFFFAALLFFVVITALYAFPLLAKFERSNKEILIWAFTLSIKNFPLTLAMVIAVTILMWLIHIIPALIFISFGMSAQFIATIMATIFRPFYPKVEEDDNFIPGDMDDPDLDDIKYLL